MLVIVINKMVLEIWSIIIFNKNFDNMCFKKIDFIKN